MHHLPDFWKAVALERIAELLRPGGVFLLRDIVYAFEPRDAEHAIEAWLGDAADDPAKGWTREQLAEHVRDEHFDVHVAARADARARRLRDPRSLDE